MTTVSAISRSDLVPVQPMQVTAVAPAQQAITSTAVAPASSTNVALGQSDDGSPVYTAEGQLTLGGRMWGHSSADAITTRIAANFGTTTAAGRLGGLGTALLERAMGGGQYSQSVWRSGSSALSLAGVSASQPLPETGNYVALDIKMASGASVTIAMGSQNDAMSVQMQVTGGTLSDTEQAALAKLAKGFQAALDGLTAQPPKLDVSGLTQYDGAAISSVDLRANIKTAANQNLSLEFHANAQSRSVQLKSPEGTVQVNVDLSKGGMTGNAAQRERAIGNYLAQFDAASSRGRGNAALNELFKSAFSSLHSDYGSTAGQQPATTSRLGGILTNSSRSMLTGLADFSVSITDKSQSLNPIRLSEKDGFSYTASQQTVSGGSGRSFSLKQTQQSQLNASFYDPLSPELSLALTTDPLSQNYFYYQVKDSASSTTDLAFEDGKMVKASLHQTADQSRRVMKYVRGELVQDLTTPLQQSREWNLLAMVESAQRYDDTQTRPDGSRLQATLSTIGDLVLLQANPASLRGKASGGAAASQ